MRALARGTQQAVLDAGLRQHALQFLDLALEVEPLPTIVDLDRDTGRRVRDVLDRDQHFVRTVDDHVPPAVAEQLQCGHLESRGIGPL